MQVLRSQWKTGSRQSTPTPSWDNKLTKGEDGHHWHRDQEALTINGEFDPIQHLETVR